MAKKLYRITRKLKRGGRVHPIGSEHWFEEGTAPKTSVLVEPAKKAESDTAKGASAAVKK